MTFFEPLGQGIPRYPKNPGNAPHAWTFPIGGQDQLFFRFSAAIFRVENAHFVAFFAPKLLIAVAIFAIFDQIWAGAPWAGVGDFINDHAPSIAVSVSASHYLDFYLPKPIWH